MANNYIPIYLLKKFILEYWKTISKSFLLVDFQAAGL